RRGGGNTASLHGAVRSGRGVVPPGPSTGDVPHAADAGAAPPQREPVAGIGSDAGPYPPGAYPVVVVGSGPGGLQVSYCLRRLGIRHALISQDPEPAGMFRRFPLFERLITWTKPYAPFEPGTREYEWYDWNSLLADERDARAMM